MGLQQGKKQMRFLLLWNLYSSEKRKREKTNPTEYICNIISDSDKCNEEQMKLNKEREGGSSG